MEEINFIRDERLALVDILQARREQLLDVLENISSISLEDLGKVLEQYCAIRTDIILMVDRLDDMEKEFLSNQLKTALLRASQNGSFQSQNTKKSLDQCYLMFYLFLISAI